MYEQLTASFRSPDARSRAKWVALFWVFSYAILSVRAQLIASDISLWISGLRIVSITAGALFFALALWATVHLPTVAGRPAILLFNLAAAVLTILAIRYILAPESPNLQSAIGAHARWALVWAGYFGLSVGAFLIMNGKTAAAHASPAVTSPGSVRAIGEPLDEPTVEAWAWFAVKLAEESGHRPRETKAALIAALRRHAGYEIADPIDCAAVEQKARIRLVEQLVDSLQDTAERKPDPAP